MTPSQRATLRAAITKTEYKYFGDYELSPDEVAAVDVLVAFAEAALKEGAVCERCDGEGAIQVEDRPYPNDVSPTSHCEPCPECVS